MADIFISYARKDRSKVEPLAKALEKSGWSVWWDRTIPPGKTFDQAIEEAISAAKCVVVLWSQNSIKSDWVKEEASIGKQRSILIPAKIDAVEPPLGFRYIQASDLTDWQSQLSHTGFNGLLKAIESILSPVSMELKKEEQGRQRIDSQGKATDEAPRLNQEHQNWYARTAAATVAHVTTLRKRGIVIGAVSLVVALSFTGWFLIASQKSITIPKPYTNSIGMTFVYIAPGSFTMGSPKDEPGRASDYELQQRQVTLSNGFYMQTTEVTQRQWMAVMGDNPSVFKECGYDCPVENVSWDEVQRFIKKLNAKEGIHLYRLPKEAEWEYAARAGTQTLFASGRCLSSDQANYDGDKPMNGCPKGLNRGKTIKVGTLQPNAWGLFNMNGNVSEWVDDDWLDNFKFTRSGLVGEWGPKRGEGRVMRGGSWSFSASGCRSAYRRGWPPNHRSYNLGFRIVLMPDRQG
jgi:formylglycine-generating enzyme required for sulfatase activity